MNRLHPARFIRAVEAGHHRPAQIAQALADQIVGFLLQQAAVGGKAHHLGGVHEGKVQVLCQQLPIQVFAPAGREIGGRALFHFFGDEGKLRHEIHFHAQLPGNPGIAVFLPFGDFTDMNPGIAAGVVKQTVMRGFCLPPLSFFQSQTSLRHV